MAALRNLQATRPPTSDEVLAVTRMGSELEYMEAKERGEVGKRELMRATLETVEEEKGCCRDINSTIIQVGDRLMFPTSLSDGIWRTDVVGNLNFAIFTVSAISTQPAVSLTLQYERHLMPFNISDVLFNPCSLANCSLCLDFVPPWALKPSNGLMDASWFLSCGCDDNGFTPLMSAAHANDVLLIKQLAGQGGGLDVNQHGARGCTAAHIAATLGHKEAIVALVN